jgi:hypothetical protein
MQSTEHKTFQAPDETREFPNGHAEILSFGGGEVGRLVFDPGWRWSHDVKPIAKTESCQAPLSKITSAGDWRSEWTTGPSLSPARATLRRCRAVTTHG